MPSDERRHRRADDSDETFVSHVRAADTGLQMSRRAVEIIILLVGFGVTIGMNWQRFNNLTDKVTELAVSLAAVRQDANDAAVDAKFARELAQLQEKKEMTREFEMAQWRATMEAIAMIQRQGGGQVTVTIPKKAKENP